MGKSAGKHGNLNATASRVYEAIRREHPNMTKKSAARIANASYAGSIDHKRGKHSSKSKGRKKR